MSKSVLILGGVSWNLLLYLHSLPEPKPHTVFARGWHETIGQTGAGKALNLQKLGLNVTLHALIGDDEYGRRVRTYLEQEGISFIYDLDPAGTERHVNLMSTTGQRVSIYVEAGTFAPEVSWQRLEQPMATHDFVAVNITNYCRDALPRLQRLGKDIWCDIHDYDGQEAYHQDFIGAADYLLLSSDRMPDYRPFMEQMRAQGKKLVVCTHERDGATALTADGRWIETPIVAAYDARRRDSNGAGDAFFSGLLFGQIRGYEVATCMRLGALVSGLCVTSQELAAPDLTETAVRAAYKEHYGATLN